MCVVNHQRLWLVLISVYARVLRSQTLIILYDPKESLQLQITSVFLTSDGRCNVPSPNVSLVVPIPLHK